MSLIIRPLALTDAPAIQNLAGAYEVALNTLMIPHPYPEGAAEQWIQNAGEHTFAIDVDGQFVGATGLKMSEDELAEVGYWVGVPYWGRGYASQAARQIIRYGFEERGLQRIFAAHFARNPASGKVLANAGMTFEGTLRRHVKKWGEYLDVHFYGILRDEWLSARGTEGRTAERG